MSEKEEGGLRDRANSPEQRAKVVARFASIETPSSEQVRQATAALGVHKEQLYRLARIWRLHGRIDLRLGSSKNNPTVRAAAIAAADGPLDLSDFDPVRHAELTRRIRIIGRYLRADTIARSATDAYAAEYGVNYKTFRGAVTAWMLTPEPSSLPGVSDWTDGPARNHGRIDPVVVDLVTEAIDAAGFDVSGPTLVRRVAEACHARGLRIPSTAFTMQRRAEARRAHGEQSGNTDSTICLDRVAINLASPDGEGTLAIGLVLLFGSKTGRILSHGFTSGPPSPRDDARVIEEFLRSGPAGPSLLLEMALPKGPGWTSLVKTLREGGVEVVTPAHRMMRSGMLSSEAFGWRIEGLRLRKISARVLDRMVPGAKPSDDDVEMAAAAVEAHNRRRSPSGSGLTSLERSANLADSLAVLGR